MNNPVHSYKLNAANAKQVGASAFIEEKGAYKGTFIRAEAVASPKGTQGIEFDFKSEDGATAKYLTVWTVNGEGKELYGRKVIDAIMTCMGVREITAAPAMVAKYNNETRAEEQVRATVFPALMGKPVGLVLAREEYLPSTGNETKWKNQIVCPFEAATDRIAIERLDNVPAEGLEKILRMLRDRPMKGAVAKQGNAHQREATAGSTQGGFADMDDEIPF